MQEIKTKKLKIGELINEFDGKHNSFVISFQASTTNANDLQNFIHNNPSSTTFIEIEGLRDGKELKNRWGLLTLEIGDLKLLVLGHLVCLCTDGDCCQFAHFTGEDKLEPMNSFGVCCKVYSHDALGSKSARFRVEKSHEFDTGSLKMKFFEKINFFHDFFLNFSFFSHFFLLFFNTFFLFFFHQFWHFFSIPSFKLFLQLKPWNKTLNI